MRLRVLLVVFVGACLLQGSENLWAQSFDGGSITNNGYSSSTGQSGVISWGPGPATDVEQSAGQFTIVVNPAYASSSLLTMLPLPDPSNPYAASYDPSTDRLTSGFLYDPGTQIGRSTSTTVGSSNYVGGLPVGSATGPVVANSSISAYPATYTTPATGTRMVFTQLNSMNLSGNLAAGGGSASISVTAGTAAGDPNLPASPGEVISNSGNSGNPSLDFPAQSFFNVFVDVNLPVGSLTNATVGSVTGDPLIIANPAITSFPPVVLYTHSGNSTAVPILFESSANAFGAPAGSVFGILTLAGHGQGYGDPATDENTGLPASPQNFENAYAQMTELPVAAGSPYVGWGGTDPVRVVPEPSTLALLGVGAVGLIGWAWRRRRS